MKTFAASVPASGIISGVASASHGDPTTRVVDGVGSGISHYSTIQSAIDAADPGDTVFIEDGTYEENLLVNTDDLTVRGESRTGVVIDASQQTGRGIEAGAADLVFESFTLIGTETPSTGYGLKVEPDEDNVEISQVTVKDSRRTGIDIHGVTGGRIEDVHVEGTESGNGIALTDCDEVTVTGASTIGNGWGGLALYTSGDYVDAGLSGITVEGSSFTDEPAGLYTQDTGGTGPGGFTDLTVTRNEFIDNEIGVLNQGGDLDVVDNRFEIPEDITDQWFHVYFTDGAQGDVRDNGMSGAHRAGILIDGAATEATVRANKVVGSGPKQSGWAENGIQVSRGAVAEVRNNVVESTWWEGADWSASGILVVDTDEVTVRSNLVKDTELALGIVSFFESEPTSRNVLERNTVKGGAFGVALQAVGTFGPPDPEVSDNTVTNNVLNSRDGEIGISESEFGEDAVAEENSFVKNKVHGYDQAFSGVDDEDREDSVITPINP